MQIPIINGIYADSGADWRPSYPINLEPNVLKTGLSEGYLRSAPGITFQATGPGVDRGGFNWNGIGYRVMGGRFVSVSGATVTDLGAVAGTLPVSMDNGFDYQAIVGGGNFYLYNGTTLAQNTDPDLGTVIDMLWVDGYYMLTDGTYLLVTELGNPFSIDPLKYGSSEEDPDPINGLMKVRGEVYAVNRFTIENLQNVGGTGFPFARNNGGLIPKGCIGTHAKAYFGETFAFVGGAKNEALSVYLADAGTAIPISTPEIDREINAVVESDKPFIECESRYEEDEERLYIHLPTKTLVFLRKASIRADEPIWYILTNGSDLTEPYPLRHLTLVGGKWIGGDAAGRVGWLDTSIDTRFGELVGTQFDTMMIYNEGRGAIVTSLELIGLPGRAPFGENPTIFMSMTFDGQTYTQERAISMGRAGQRDKRVQWRPMKRFRNYAGLRFRTLNTSIASWARLEGAIMGLNG